jgi:hypothetical protein
VHFTPLIAPRCKRCPSEELTSKGLPGFPSLVESGFERSKTLEPKWTTARSIADTRTRGLPMALRTTHSDESRGLPPWLLAKEVGQ